MTQEEFLLQQILDRPDDDAPRLAYAEHMNAIRDPRGEFIELDVELDRIHGNYSDPNFLPLAEKSHVLIERYGVALAGPVASLVDDYSFKRGMVERVDLTARQFLELAPRLFAMAPIRHLNLKNVRVVIRELFSSPHLARIRSISLQNNHLTDPDIDILAASPYLQELRWLSLADNEVGRLGAEALAASQNLPRLRYVVFRGNPFNPSERFGHDQGFIVESWMPEEGEALEGKYGPLPWLHAGDPRTTSDLPPSRFIL